MQSSWEDVAGSAKRCRYGLGLTEWRNGRDGDLKFVGASRPEVRFGEVPASSSFEETWEQVALLFFPAQHPFPLLVTAPPFFSGTTPPSYSVHEVGW